MRAKQEPFIDGQSGAEIISMPKNSRFCLCRMDGWRFGRFVLLIIGVGLIAIILGSPFSHKVNAQYRIAEDGNAKRAAILSGALLSETGDLRRQLFSQDVIEDRGKRGVVCLILWQLDNVTEHDTNNWKTVEDMLRSQGWFDRRKRRPQIRVISKDAILQSSVSSSLGDGPESSGYSIEFLRHKFVAGDIIVYAMISN